MYPTTAYDVAVNAVHRPVLLSELNNIFRDPWTNVRNSMAAAIYCHSPNEAHWDPFVAQPPALLLPQVPDYNKYTLHDM